MQQIALDLYRIESPTLENFIAGRNGEALACLRALRDAPASHPVPARLIHLWGEPGSGKTHLAQATAAGSRVVAATAPISRFEALIAEAAATPTGNLRIMAVTNLEKLDPARQTLVFHLVNRVHAHAGTLLLTTGAQAPLALPLREELRTRIGAGVVYRLHLLDDADKTQALERMARLRGVRIAPDVVHWLLRHTSRDIRALMQLFDGLDRHAFERQRAITLPLLREWLEAAGVKPASRDLSAASGTGRPDADQCATDEKLRQPS